MQVGVEMLVGGPAGRCSLEPITLQLVHVGAVAYATDIGKIWIIV